MPIKPCHFLHRAAWAFWGSIAAATLSACGGGGSGGTSSSASASSSVDARNAMGLQTSAQAPQQDDPNQAASWPPAPQFVYHQEAPFLGFSPHQLEVSTRGDTFVTWHATHKTAQGEVDGTDINIMRRDAQGQTWRTTTLSHVPFPSAGGGFVYNLKLQALPQGDMLALWDVVDIPSDDPNKFNKPPQVHVSRYVAAQDQWSPPTALPGDYAIYSFHNGWEIVPAGDGKVLMLWQTGQGHAFHARFYSAQDGTWSEPQEVGSLIGLTTPIRGNGSGSAWTVFSSFNRAGTGVVQFNDRTAAALYFDAARQTWRAASVVPPVAPPAHPGAPAHWYYFGFVVEHPFAVDEDGNVLSALVDQDPFTLRLSKWSVATGQIERTQVVETFSALPSGVSLNIRPDGGLLTWARYGDSPFSESQLRHVPLSREGIVQGSPQTGALLSDVAPLTYALDLQTRITPSGAALALWSRSQCMFEAGCKTVDFLFSTLQPGQGWSPPQRIPSVGGMLTDRAPFKASPSGGAALVMPDLRQEGVSPNTRHLIDVHVTAWPSLDLGR